MGTTPAARAALPGAARLTVLSIPDENASHAIAWPCPTEPSGKTGTMREIPAPTRRNKPVSHSRNNLRNNTRKRTLRRSDGTVSVEGIRYQVPQPWRHLREAWVRYARWDLASVDLVDGRGGERLCTLYPLDKRGNADGVRRRAGGDDDHGGGGAGAGELPPLLKGILDDQEATGLPPAWLPHRETPGPGDDDRGETS